MQYMLHNGPYRSRPQDRLLVTRFFWSLGRHLASGYTLALKVVLIGCVAFGFFQLVAYLLTLSDSALVQLPALAAWACGAIPLSYRLWRLDLGNHRPARAVLAEDLLHDGHFG
jgi:hypothetical protein